MHTLIRHALAAFKITTPGGKVIVTDPWLRTNPLTPPAFKQLDVFGHIDVLPVSHGHFDHVADAPALAQWRNPASNKDETHPETRSRAARRRSSSTRWGRARSA